MDCIVIWWVMCNKFVSGINMGINIVDFSESDEIKKWIVVLFMNIFNVLVIGESGVKRVERLWIIVFKSCFCLSKIIIVCVIFIIRVLYISFWYLFMNVLVILLIFIWEISFVFIVIKINKFVILFLVYLKISV